MKKLEEGDVVLIAGWESLGPFEYLGWYMRHTTDERINRLRYMFGPQAGEIINVLAHAHVLKVKEPKND